MAFILSKEIQNEGIINDNKQNVQVTVEIEERDLLYANFPTVNNKISEVCREGSELLHKNINGVIVLFSMNVV